MKKLYSNGNTLLFFLMSIIAFIGFMSCIQPELPNAECDIIAAFMPGKTLVAPTLIENFRIIFTVADKTGIDALAPEFEITDGAFIVPASGSIQDFTSGEVLYTVYSEDGLWSKTYAVQVGIPVIKTDYEFETYETLMTTVLGKPRETYQVFYESVNGEKKYIWASGNAGFKLSMSSALPDQYPTFAGPGYDGTTGAHLVTRSTGSLGAIAGMPIAAGNLFTGNFDVKNAMAKPLEATQFGTPFGKEPVRLTGYYTYTPGAVFTDKSGREISGKTDGCDIYAVFYETDETTPYLTGVDILESPNIVAIAKSPAPLGAPSAFTFFDFPFVYEPGKSIDAQKLAEFGYNLAIIFSSSKDGALFEGAIGSTLVIDKVSVICAE